MNYFNKRRFGVDPEMDERPSVAKTPDRKDIRAQRPTEGLIPFMPYQRFADQDRENTHKRTQEFRESQKRTRDQREESPDFYEEPQRAPKRRVFEGDTLSSFVKRKVSEGTAHFSQIVGHAVECARQVDIKSMASEGVENALQLVRHTVDRARTMNIGSPVKILRTLKDTFGMDTVEKAADYGDAASEGGETDFSPAASQATQSIVNPSDDEDADGDSIMEDDDSTISGPYGFRATRSATYPSSSYSDDDDSAAVFHRLRRCHSF